MHGYDYREFWYEDFTEEEFPGIHHGRLPVWPIDQSMTSPCWLKIPAIAKSLERSGLGGLLRRPIRLILDFSKDIGDELPPDKWLAMHEDTTFDGTGPNIGVVVTRACEQSCKFWREAWDIDAWRTATWTDHGKAHAPARVHKQAPGSERSETPNTPRLSRSQLGMEWQRKRAGNSEARAARLSCRIWWKLDLETRGHAGCRE